MEKQRFQSRIALVVIVGLSCYQLFLCFLNTHVFGINNGIVAATEAMIMMLAALKVAANTPISRYTLPVMVLSYFMLLFAIRGDVDLQGLRNLFIIYIMFSLGRLTASRRDANIIIWVLSVIALMFALFEYFKIDLYLELFNILQYYNARGLVSEEQLSYLSSNLWISGTRMGGRTLLPFLGEQRVSSIFLEPVSMGNYAVIVTMWALSFDMKDWRKSIGHFFMGAFFIIACDSRFASLIIVLLCVFRFVPLLQKSYLLYVMPICCVAAQVYFASLKLVDSRMDDLGGRLAKAGDYLFDMRLAEIFGIGDVVQLYDLGVPYSLVVFGIVLCMFLWMRLVFMRFPAEQGTRMRAMLCVYCIGILLISGTSFYSSKTAGLLWFILGALARAEPKAPDRIPADGQSPPEEIATAH